MGNKTILVLVPVDCRPEKSARTRRVIAALQARGWSPVTLGDVVPKRHRRTLVAEDLVGRAIRPVERAGLVVAGEDPRFAGRFRCYEQTPSEVPA